ncbi:MAG: MBL fold metallo-hydrolase [Candidatus Lokiarchaeota archaeon]|nr:MBL fold metallo-hydrolase [Candidatus Lokiarchaeota archaeon]
MEVNTDWFEVYKENDYVYVIKENLEAVDPRFRTEFTNLYLLIGSKKALLIDTGSGLYSLKHTIDDLISNKELIVINTHSHWDHVGCNSEFQKIFIHEIEGNFITNPVNITNLKDSPQEIAKKYEKNNYLLPPAKDVEKINENDEFDLGGISVKIIHTPGHSPGSISLLTNRGGLFVGDLAHYGSVFLPKKKNLPIVLESLAKLQALFEDNKSIQIFPGHEETPTGKELLDKLYEGVEKIKDLWSKKQKDQFLHSWIIEDPPFDYVISKF